MTRTSMPPFFERLLRPLRGSRVKLTERITCPTLALGTADGGYEICATGVGADATVYSFGVGFDISFDQELILRRGVTVHAFDPKPSSIEWVETQELSERFVFHPWGIATFDGTASFHSAAIDAPVYRLRTIMSKLGHERIDVLKLNIEGAELAVLGDVLVSDLAIPQILVEFYHDRLGVPLEHTQSAVESLQRAGYRAFSASAKGREISFLRPDLVARNFDR